MSELIAIKTVYPPKFSSACSTKIDYNAINGRQGKVTLHDVRNQRLLSIHSLQ